MLQDSNTTAFCSCNEDINRTALKCRQNAEHVNVASCLAIRLPANAICCGNRCCCYQLEAFDEDNVADLLLCQLEMLEGTSGLLFAQLLILQTLQGLHSVHSSGRFHGGIQPVTLQLHDLQYSPRLPKTRAP
jgi:hypothetical protein